MADSIFGKIIRGEIPCHKIYEDAHCLAFLDVHPHAKGHTLVVPKNEAETIFDLTDQDVSCLMIGVKHAMERLDTVLHPHGFTVGWNHGTAGGQAVPQVHVHILPRWHNDGGESIHAVISNPGDMTVADVAALFA